MKAPESHRHAAPKVVGFYVVTVSSSRFAKKESGEPFLDESGDLAKKIITRSGHKVKGSELVDDDKEMIIDALKNGIATPGVDVVVFTGGTGVSPRDVTVEAVRPSLDKEIPGFGEVMRSVSYARIGSPAMLSRATAGLVRGKLVLLLPGSPDAVETGLNLLIGDVPHIVYVAHKRG